MTAPRFLPIHASRSWWQIVATDHDHCARCDDQARRGAILAAATGAVAACPSESVTLADPCAPPRTDHGATVARVDDLAVFDPDDTTRNDPPLWEGPPRALPDVALRPRTYRAAATVRRDVATTDTVPVLLTVHPSGSIFLTGADR